MVLLSKAFTGVPPLQLTKQPHFMRLRSNVAWEVMWRHSGPFGFDLVRKSRVPDFPFVMTVTVSHPL